MFLLNKGKVIQQMNGEYDSYGRVFIDGTQDKTNSNTIRESQNWTNPFPDKLLSDYEQKNKDNGDKNWA